MRYKLIKEPLVLLSIVTRFELSKVCRERSQNQVHNQHNSLFTPAHATLSFHDSIGSMAKSLSAIIWITSILSLIFIWRVFEALGVPVDEESQAMSARYSPLYLSVSDYCQKTFSHGSSCYTTAPNFAAQINNIPMLIGMQFKFMKESVDIVLGCMDLDLSLSKECLTATA
jgi:hypothetical protein